MRELATAYFWRAWNLHGLEACSLNAGAQVPGRPAAVDVDARARVWEAGEYMEASLRGVCVCEGGGRDKYVCV